MNSFRLCRFNSLQFFSISKTTFRNTFITINRQVRVKLLTKNLFQCEVVAEICLNMTTVHNIAKVERIKYCTNTADLPQNTDTAVKMAKNLLSHKSRENVYA